MPTRFETEVWNLCAKIPKGKVSTYGAIAQGVGIPNGARAVGNALNCNPYAPTVPCHRVVKSNGSIGGYAYGTRKKIQLLEREGVSIINGKITNFNQVLYHF